MMPPRMPFLRTPPALSFQRAFSSTPHCAAKSSRKRLEIDHSTIPPYPYGPSLIYKQSNFGLYGNQKIRFGNKVSEKNEIKTRRYWRPNVQQKRLWSESLKKFVRLRITTRVLRTVDKCGGLDEYLLGEKPARIKELGMGGWLLRWRVMQTKAYKERLRKVWESYGLPPPEELLSSGLPTTTAQQLVAQQLVAKQVKKIDEMLEDDSEESVIDIGEDVEGEGEELAADVFEHEESGFMKEEPATGHKTIL